MKTFLILLASIFMLSCTTRAEFINRDYLKVDRYDGISKKEATAIANYYFQYKQSAFKHSGSVFVDRNPEELKESWKFRVISKQPNVDVHVSYLVDKKDGQIKEINESPSK